MPLHYYLYLITFTLLPLPYYLYLITFTFTIFAGLITSICQSIHHNNALKGITCIDIRIADILGDIEYQLEGEYSYTFLIDKTGRTLLHPLLPNPFKVLDDPTFIDIETLERSQGINTIIRV